MKVADQTLLLLYAGIQGFLVASTARTTGGTSRVRMLVALPLPANLGSSPTVQDPTVNPRGKLRNQTGTPDAQSQVALEAFPSLALRALSKVLERGSTGADSHLPMPSIRRVSSMPKKASKSVIPDCCEIHTY
ncbi:hypothetical protein JTB14_021648 [Gonioctena quinquepunctata]|nr:hypothetical protein JTB14_021648 [Gonioctena quinquepunctata]